MKEIKIPTSTICGAAVALAGTCAGNIVGKGLAKAGNGRFADVFGTAVVVGAINFASLMTAFKVACNEKLDLTIKIDNCGGKRLKKNKDEEPAADEEPDYPAEFL